MDYTGLVNLTRGGARPPASPGGKVLLVKPPYFSPLTPPLGIAILRSFVEQHGYSATCMDLNTDPELWGMHHKYFGVLQALEGVSINDGYSKLWWVLNAHMLARANGADAARCAKVLAAVTPLYGIACDERATGALLPLVDRFYARLEEVIDEADLSGYGVVGTSTYTTSLGPSLFLLRKLKEKYPRLKTVMGGGAFADDLALGSDNLDTLVNEYNYVDHIILGEGELLFLKLLQGELAHKRVISIADLRGETLKMEDVPAPDFSDVDQKNYLHLSIEGARSCPFQCSFCSETIQWGDYRKKPADLFAGQVVELARRYGNNSFFMGDSLMNPYINSFASELTKRRAGILYDGYLRADKPVANREFVRRWAESGCYRVRLGIESASARVLDAMDKMTTPKVISDVLKTLAAAGIRTTTYWIVGFPGETEEEFQETCDFIREHSRYIYELEAHPYYYYPYGQVGSRLHQCHSLYGEEVTDIIKFKVWDIIDARPTRAERYDRLRRISAMASDLGLPNIYTMAERYEAEERWHSLHPLTTEVYAGSLRRRAKAESCDRARKPAPPQEGLSPVLCYQVSVGKRLEEEILSTALERLIEYNEVLHEVAGEGDETPHGGRVRGGELLRVYDFARGDAPPEEDSRGQVAAALSAEVGPACGARVRCALLRRGEAADELLLLVHRSAADGRTVTILLEDLYRIYEQLSHGKEVSLIPPGKTYAESAGLAAEAGGGLEQPPRPAAPDGPRETRSAVVELDESLTAELLGGLPARLGLTWREALICAALRSLSSAAADADVDVTVDYRDVDKKFGRTAGPLTFVRRLPRGAACEGESPVHVMRRLRAELSEASPRGPRPDAGRADEGAAARPRLLLNLEQMLDVPWLGGLVYAPEGFVHLEAGAGVPYCVDAAASRRGESVRLHLRYREGEAGEEIAAALRGRLGAELRAVLDECRRYDDARQFWDGEFEGELPVSSTLAAPGEAESAPGGRAETRFEVERSVVESACSRCDAEAPLLMLAAFGALLSRLNDGEDLALVCDVGGEDAGGVVPLKLSPSWVLPFAEFVSQLGRQLSRALAHGEYAFDILAGGLGSTGPGRAPRLDLGFVARDEGAGVERIEETLEPYAALGRGTGLALAVEGEGSSLRLIYDRERLAPGEAEALAGYLKTLLREVAADPSSKLGDIPLDIEQKRGEAAPALGEELFNF
jgi:hypothetical protein